MKTGQLETENKSDAELIKELLSEIAKKDLVIEKLSNELQFLRRKLFGSSSERYIPNDPQQLKLALDGTETLPEEAEEKEEAIEVSYTRKKQTKQPVRQSISEEIRREEVVIEPENIPEGAVRIGEAVTEKIEYKPGEVYVKRIVRPKYALPKKQGIIVADLPTQVLPKSNAGASLLAFLAISKYLDHLPFHRIIEIFKRQKIFLSPSTINDWFSDMVDLLEPLYECLKKVILESDYLQLDESTIPIVDKDKPGSTKKGYFWIARNPMLNQLFFHYQKGSRAQKVVVELLQHFKGAVQCDAYGAYSIYEKKKGVLLLGCMAHARRKFEQAKDNDKVRAEYALKMIRDLYDIERIVKDQSLSFEQIKTVRQQVSYPILQAFEQWMIENKSKVLPSSLIGKAIAYSYNIFPRLARYVVDGRYNIDNNGAENGIRPMALGRKNYLFCGNDEAARRTAIIYSLLGSCKLAGVNPTEWLTDVLNRIPDHKANQLSELLPTNWKALQK